MRRRVVKYSVVAAVLATLITCGIFATRNDFGLGRNMEIMINLMRTISTNYVNEVDADKMMKSAADGITKILDPYSVYIPESEMAEFNASTTGHYGGIGSIIRQKDGGAMIAEPYKGSPADEAGLIIGDQIVAINGKDMTKTSIDQISSLLRGEPNSTVTVTVKRLLTGKNEDITIRRRRIDVPSIPYSGYVAEGIGYIQHSDFTENCYVDMRAAINELKKSGKLECLILDYRNNGGGLLNAAIDVLSLFVPKGTKVVEIRGRGEKDGGHKFFTNHEPILANTPIVVLINGSSASAAEIVAGAIQDLDRGVLIGQRSFGKGLVQTSIPLGYNTCVKVTTAKYYTPSGRCIQAIDYSKEGKARVAADSLIKEFKTSRGRKVYDGGGIMPDRVIKPDYTNNFVAALYILGVINDYGDSYFKRNHAKSIDVKSFSITEGDYAEFVAMADSVDIPYKSESRIAIEKLQSALANEKNNAYDQMLEEMTKGLKDDKKSMLERFRKEITTLINSDIVLRYAYNEGVVQHSLGSDNVVKEAVELLRNAEEYNRIRTSQDTKRK